MEIINGQIHTMGAQGVIKHGAVRVENGKIAWVGTMKQWQEMKYTMRAAYRSWKGLRLSVKDQECTSAVFPERD